MSYMADGTRDLGELRPYFRDDIARVLMSISQARPDWFEPLASVGNAFGVSLDRLMTQGAHITKIGVYEER